MSLINPSNCKFSHSFCDQRQSFGLSDPIKSCNWSRFQIQPAVPLHLSSDWTTFVWELQTPSEKRRKCRISGRARVQPRLPPGSLWASNCESPTLFMPSNRIASRRLLSSTNPIQMLQLMRKESETLGSRFIVLPSSSSWHCCCIFAYTRWVLATFYDSDLGVLWICSTS